MIVLDASLLIGLLEPADTHHQAAVDLLAASTGPLVVHTLTLAEVLVGLARTGREREAQRDLEGIGVQATNLGPNEALTLARLRADHRLSIPDTCVLAVATHLNAPLITFDSKLAAAARELNLLYDK